MSTEATSSALTSTEVQLINVRSAGVVIYATIAFVLLYIGAVHYKMSVTLNNATHSSIIIAYAVIVVVILVAYLIISVLPDLITSIDSRVIYLRILFYALGLVSLLFWAFSVYFTGGPFNSKFSWIYQVILVLSIQLMRYAPGRPWFVPARFRRWFPPIFSVVSIIVICALLEGCFRPYPDARDVNQLPIVQWGQFVWAAITIVFIQIMCELVRPPLPEPAA
jgi:hypothetical protein